MLMMSDDDGQDRKRRRTWTNEEKWRIVEEARLPGVAVAEVARRRAVNNNQLFGWIQQAETGQLGPRPADLELAPIPVERNEFIPIGVFGHCDEEGPALIASPPVVRSSNSTAPTWSGLPRKGPALDERPGVIEVDLPSGVRIRVDPFVNEKALRRVLTALQGKA